MIIAQLNSIALGLREAVDLINVCTSRRCALVRQCAHQQVARRLLTQKAKDLPLIR